MIEGMEQVRMTDAEVANNFAAVLEKLKHGAEVVVEQGYRRVAVISPVKGPGRPIDECIALVKAHGSGAELDEEICRGSGGDHRQPPAARHVGMGLILDSSAVIAGERKKQSVADLLARSEPVWDRRRLRCRR